MLVASTLRLHQGSHSGGPGDHGPSNFSERKHFKAYKMYSFGESKKVVFTLKTFGNLIGRALVAEN